jgi:hypothetical protein
MKKTKKKQRKAGYYHQIIARFLIFGAVFLRFMSSSHHYNTPYPVNSKT